MASLRPASGLTGYLTESRAGATGRRIVPGGRTALLSAFCSILALGLGTPAGATQLYHSPNDDGEHSAGAPSVPEGGARSVYLYIDGGALASAVDTACDTGSGSEVCGFTVMLTGLAGLTLAGFMPDAGADLMYDLTALELRVNGLDTAAPTPGPQRVGELLVNAVTGGSLELSSGEVIGADLSSEILPVAEVVAAPEPGFLLQLATGGTLLACLGRRRARR